MKTTESRFVVVSADLLWGDTQAVGDKPPILKWALDQIPATAVALGRSMFLFDTHKDYEGMDRLLLAFRQANRVAVALPVGAGLSILCDEPMKKAISEAFPELQLYVQAPISNK